MIKFIKNRFGATHTADPTNIYEPNYSLYGEVRVENTPGVFTKTADFLLDPIANNTAFFVANSAIKGFFKFTPFNPNAVTSIQKVTDNIIKAQLFCGEHFGTIPAVQGELVLKGEYLVLNGGISDEVGFNDGLSMLENGKKFLTWAPLIRTIGLSTPELLHFLIPTGMNTANLRVRLSYADGTEDLITAKTLAGLAENDLIRIPAGVDALGLLAYDLTKDLTHYEVFLTDQAGTVMTESRFYEIDDFVHVNERHWMYTNSLGMPEILRTIGKSVLEHDISSTTYRKALPIGYNNKESQYRTNSAISRSRQEVSTGFLKDQEAQAYILDMLLTNGQMWDVSTSYYPVQLDGSGGFSEKVDGEYQYFARFRVRGGFDARSYTPKS